MYKYDPGGCPPMIFELSVVKVADIVVELAHSTTANVSSKVETHASISILENAFICDLLHCDLAT